MCCKTVIGLLGLAGVAAAQGPGGFPGERMVTVTAGVAHLRGRIALVYLRPEASVVPRGIGSQLVTTSEGALSGGRCRARRAVTHRARAGPGRHGHGVMRGPIP
jgi:hypothetical protein